MSEKITIILPGKIGDIIICLPIAKHFHDVGYDVHWAVYNHLISNFNKGHIDYVTFIPVNFITAIKDSHDIAKQIGGEVLDLSFTCHGCWDNQNSKTFLNQRERTFDEFRYHLANVPFEKKWDLSIIRNKNRELELYSKLVDYKKYNEKFVVFQNQASDTNVNFKLDLQGRNYQVIELKPYTDCVFDWITLLEEAKKLVLIESSISNLVDQLKIKTDKILLMKKNYYRDKLDGRDLYLGTPILKSNWRIVT